jgi:hypothetical protein
MAKLINKAYDCPDWPTVPTGLAVLTIVFSEILRMLPTDFTALIRLTYNV